MQHILLEILPSLESPHAAYITLPHKHTVSKGIFILHIVSFRMLGL